MDDIMKAFAALELLANSDELIMAVAELKEKIIAHNKPKRNTAYNMFVAEYMKKNKVIDEYGVDRLLTWQAARQAWKEYSCPSQYLKVN